MIGTDARGHCTNLHFAGLPDRGTRTPKKVARTHPSDARYPQSACMRTLQGNMVVRQFCSTLVAAARSMASGATPVPSTTSAKWTAPAAQSDVSNSRRALVDPISLARAMGPKAGTPKTLPRSLTTIVLAASKEAGKCNSVGAEQAAADARQTKTP